MLVRSVTEQVDANYVASPGQEVYDTIAGTRVRGNGYSTVTELLTGDVVDEVSNYLLTYVEAGSLTLDNPLNISTEALDDTTPTVVGFQFSDVPTSWFGRTLTLEALIYNSVDTEGDIVLTVVGKGIDTSDMTSVTVANVEDLVVTMPDTEDTYAWYTISTEFELDGEMNAIDLITVSVTRVSDAVADDHAEPVGIIALKLS